MRSATFINFIRSLRLSVNKNLQAKLAISLLFLVSKKRLQFCNSSKRHDLRIKEFIQWSGDDDVCGCDCYM